MTDGFKIIGWLDFYVFGFIQIFIYIIIIKICWEMSFLRSKNMKAYQLIVAKETQSQVLDHIGRLGKMEFKKKKNMYLDREVNRSRRIIDTSLNNIEALQRSFTNNDLHHAKNHYTEQQYQAFLSIYDSQANPSHPLVFLQQTANQVNRHWSDSQKLQKIGQQLMANNQKYRQQRGILLNGHTIFGNKLYQSQQLQKGHNLTFKCGVISKQLQQSFKRTLVRITRGFCFIQTHQIQEYQTFHVPGSLFKKNQHFQPEIQYKKVSFFLFYNFRYNKSFQGKIQKLCETNHVEPFSYPVSELQHMNMLTYLQNQIKENNKTLNIMLDEKINNLQPLFHQIYHRDDITLNYLEYYKLFFLHEKFISQTTQQMRAFPYCYENVVYMDDQSIEPVVKSISQHTGKRLQKPQFTPVRDDNLPTYTELNQVTKTPYQILSAYGIPRYQEINPLSFNLVTFPFFFGVMFGDIGHGSIVFSFGLALVFFHDYYKNGPLAGLAAHRYTLALMGFFALYCGFIYNDCVSISLNLFGSCYDIGGGKASREPDCVYAFGVDPVWAKASNSMNFMNSLKMKIAVVIAIVHMFFGLILKGCNFWFSKQRVLIFLQVIPQILFFTLLFGYMDFLIIYKWLKNWTNLTPPSIITTLINLPLKFGGTTNCCGGEPMWGQFQNTSQNSIQLVFFAISLICVPIMLFLPPLYHYFCEHSSEDQSNSYQPLDEMQKEMINRKLDEGQKPEEHKPLSQIFIYQIIEVIEFVLGCISNTASYLRLWALSLAHNQLSQVFFEQTVVRGLITGYQGIVFNVLFFLPFAMITFGILLCMDSLECFLHTLRLHWVEFQGKFYKADGRQYKPFHFLTLTNEYLVDNQISS